jgi:3-phenylpropionate/trans-cinnamate dioxygenase ferredoxin subunit
LTTADSPRWIAVCARDRLADHGILGVRAEGIDLILLRHGDRFHAFERACPHEQADLAFGCVRDGRLFCPRHQASFGLDDGVITPGWPSRNLRSYAVRVTNQRIWIDVGSVKPAAS